MDRKSGDRGLRGKRLDPKHDARTRAKIQTSQIVNRLYSFVNGEVEMSAAQVTAGLGLLRKTLPDLSATEMKAEIEDKSFREMTDAELLAIAKSGSTGDAETEASETESDRLH